MEGKGRGATLPEKMATGPSCSVVNKISVVNTKSELMP